MKKNFLLLLTFLAFGFGLAAQTSTPQVQQTQGEESDAFSPVGRWTLGVDAGLVLNRLDAGTAYMKNYSYMPRLNFSYGLHVRYQPYKWLALRTGLYYIPKDYVLMQVDSITIDDKIEDFARGEMAQNGYLNVPFMADLSIGKKVRYQLFLGGYMGYWLNGSRSGGALPLMSVRDSYEYSEPYTFDKSRDNRFDAGLTYGLGISIPCSKRVGIDVNMHWYYGLTDLQKRLSRQHNPQYYTSFLLLVGATYTL